ncbi:MAG: lipid A deacylase LpxR family protein [Acetobacteraceae bacterium]|nr:lipid A deacylase LpxR family protein [Acetobacteraceae bacterium]
MGSSNFGCRMRIRVPAAVLACAAVSTLAAHAEPPQDPHGILTFQVENDAVSTYRGTSDQYYTSGLRLGYTTGTDAVPGFLTNASRAVWGDGVQRISIDLSQELFTPRNTQLNPPDPQDRPYAGYLHLSTQLLHDKDNSRSILGFSVGVVGPAALGEEVQNGFHRLIGNTPNQGWGHQLKNEPAFQFLVQRTYRLPIGGLGGVEFDALPGGIIGLGTVRDYAEVGFVLRFGQGLNSDFGVSRITPGFSGGDAYVPTRPFVWYVFGGADGQAVARDEFLDGSTFHSGSPHVNKRPFQGELELGAAMMLAGVRVTYTQTWQTPQFSRQRSGLFNFGSLAASVRF